MIFGGLFIGTMAILIILICIIIFPFAPKIGDKIFKYFSSWDKQDSTKSKDLKKQGDNNNV